MNLRLLFPACSLRPKPLAASLALLLAASAQAGSEPGLATAAAASTQQALRDPYALRLQQRHAPRTARAQAAARPIHAAATLPVTSCLDDADPGTLRNVLAVANEGDIIDMSQLACSTITLTQGIIDVSMLSEHQILDLTLQGSGEHALTIDGNGDRVFAHGDFRTGVGTLTINDLSIRNGNYTHGLASCLRSSGNITLNRVTIDDCHSSGGGPMTFGGALDASGTLTMVSSTISGSSSSATGDNTAVGAGAYVSGEAILIDSTISGNRVSAQTQGDELYTTGGAGLYVRGDLTISRSTISGNSVEASGVDQDAVGGGIFVSGTAHINSSTIEGNSADGSGGGVFKTVYSNYGDQGTQITVTNSTLSGNSARYGGGIATVRPLNLVNSTLAFNNGIDGGAGVMFLLEGVSFSSGILDLQSSLLANNTVGATAAFAADLAADTALAVSGANNLVVSADSAITLPADTLAADPLLAALADNGGPTRTHALGAGSLAIDAGNNAATLEFDQRGDGFARVSGASADIGAFEVQVATPSDTLFRDGFDGAPQIEYVYDDGDGDTNQGPPSSFDPDMLWGNYYLTQAGGEVITKISVAFGPTFPSLANGPVTFWLLEDADGDFDPRNARAVAHVGATPDVINDAFFSVDIPPTLVNGAFFVGASAKLQGGEDKPARVDRNASGDKSWFFYAPDIAATIDDLAAAPFGARNDDTQYVPLPGAFMVRATGTPATP